DEECAAWHVPSLRLRGLLLCTLTEPNRATGTFTMEFPTLGKQCSQRTCAQLDFLPFTCTYCIHIFCQEHWKREDHECPSLADESLDIRVPICPVCQKPVPVNRGEDPNIRVNEHIAAGCADPGTTTSPSPSSTNHCSQRGCKARTLVPIYCPRCKLNFCVKHRLELDHHCGSSASPNPSSLSGSSIVGQRSTPAALAAMRRSEAAKPKGTTAQPVVVGGAAITRAGSAPLATGGRGETTPTAVRVSASAAGTAPSGSSSRAPAGVGPADVVSRTDIERQRRERQQKRLLLEEKARKGLLTEEEQIQIATQLSLEGEENSSSTNSNCNLS
ncbi:hypothetical protein BC937DRAFT_94795, partial [Endogone sp. FLAS-F59071]